MRLQDSNVVRLMPAGPDGRELPPLQPGAEPPPAVLPAYEYASRNMQSSYAPPLETVRKRGMLRCRARGSPSSTAAGISFDKLFAMMMVTVPDGASGAHGTMRGGGIVAVLIEAVPCRAASTLARMRGMSWAGTAPRA
jgi:hypothetical protein